MHECKVKKEGKKPKKEKKTQKKKKKSKIYSQNTNKYGKNAFLYKIFKGEGGSNLSIKSGPVPPPEIAPYPLP